MKPEEQRIGKLLKNTNQYIIPRFQRSYVWGTSETDDLKGQVRIFWNDIMEITQSTQFSHFTGSIVLMQDSAKTTDVDAYKVIDGQQRLITTSLLFCALRDFTSNNAIDSRLFNEDSTIYGNLKIIVSDADRAIYENIVEKKAINKKEKSSLIFKTYDYFIKKLQEVNSDPDAFGCKVDDIYTTVADRLQIVCITLENEDAGSIFESLNYKGELLSRVDLLKNYLLMNYNYNPSSPDIVASDDQSIFVKNYWDPFASKLIAIVHKKKKSEKMDYTEPFIRHYLMMNGERVPAKSVYSIFKTKIINDNREAKESQNIEIPLTDTIESIINEMTSLAMFYRVIVKIDEFDGCSSSADNNRINLALSTMARLNSKSNGCYLLSLFKEHADGRLTDCELVQSICLVESYLIRRTMVQGGLNSNVVDVLFLRLCSQKIFSPGELLSELKSLKKTAFWPTDSDIETFFTNTPVYGRWSYTNLVLTRIDWYLNSKEAVKSDNTSMEHIMPETRSEWWFSHTDDTYDDKVNMLGNLSLTGYNPEMSNSPYPTKLEWYKKSNHPITRRLFEDKRYNREWSMDIIDNRTKELIQYILMIWPYDLIEHE